MKLQIRVDDNGRIIETAFKTFGCGSAMASSSLASEWIKGKTLDEVLEIRNQYQETCCSVFVVVIGVPKDVDRTQRYCKTPFSSPCEIALQHAS